MAHRCMAAETASIGPRVGELLEIMAAGYISMYGPVVVPERMQRGDVVGQQNWQLWRDAQVASLRHLRTCRGHERDITINIAVALTLINTEGLEELAVRRIKPIEGGMGFLSAEYRLLRLVGALLALDALKKLAANALYPGALGNEGKDRGDPFIPRI